MKLMNKNKSGFTIIEVVLVLAIAGMIFMIVFLAVPAMQRNQRDTRRKADLNRAIAAVSQYKSSHRGQLPSNDQGWQNFLKDYIITESNDEFVDPRGAKDGTPQITVGSGTNQKTVDTYQLTPHDTSDLSGDFEINKNTIYYTIGAKCQVDGAKVDAGKGNRTVALRIKLENAGWHCLDD